MLSSYANQIRSEIVERIDEATAPERFTPESALEFLGELTADLEGRMQALREENDL